MNKSGDENRSVRNTKRRLKEGLFKLLEEKPIQQISVKELTELVDINRGTFYFHYKDIESLRSQIEEDFFEQFEKVLSRDIPEDEDGAQYLKEFFIFIKENRDIVAILLGKNTDIEFIIRLKLLLCERSRNYWHRTVHYADDKKEAYYSAFILAGCVGVIKQWMDNGFEDDPEEVAKLAGAVMEAGIQPFR